MPAVAMMPVEDAINITRPSPPMLRRRPRRDDPDFGGSVTVPDGSTMTLRGMSPAPFSLAPIRALSYLTPKLLAGALARNFNKNFDLRYAPILRVLCATRKRGAE